VIIHLPLFHHKDYLVHVIRDLKATLHCILYKSLTITVTEQNEKNNAT